jgi:hypothetical protein
MGLDRNMYIYCAQYNAVTFVYLYSMWNSEVCFDLSANIVLRLIYYIEKVDTFEHQAFVHMKPINEEQRRLKTWYKEAKVDSMLKFILTDEL